MTPDDFLAKPDTKYSDWFGDGSSHADYMGAVNDYGKPDAVYQKANMLALVYSDKIVVIGYDGNEYTHEFVFQTNPVADNDP